MTKYLQDTPLQALLPAAIAEDPQIRTAATAFTPLLHTLAKSLPNLLIFGRLGKQDPATMLPPLQRLTNARDGLSPLSAELVEQLAWQLHVDFRELAKTTDDLARMTQQSIAWHRIKGTPAGMKMAFALFGMPVTIEEGAHGMHWASYQLGFKEVADVETVALAWKIALEMQPARCRLARIYTNTYDWRPIVLNVGPALSEGFLSFYSGVPVPEVDDELIVSFGVRHAVQSEKPSLQMTLGISASHAMLIEYLDAFTVGRSRLSDVFPRNHGFSFSEVYSRLIADTTFKASPWGGAWGGPWAELSHFERHAPPSPIAMQEVSRSQACLSEAGKTLSDINTRLGTTSVTTIGNPAKLSEFALSEHDNKRQIEVLHEMFIKPVGLHIESFNTQGPFHAGITEQHAMLVEYIDSITLGRSRLSDILPRNSCFAFSEHRSAQIADITFKASSWGGAWGGPWLELSHFERHAPPSPIAVQEVSRSQACLSESGKVLSDINMRLGVTTTTTLGNPPKLSQMRLSEHDSELTTKVLHEMLVDKTGLQSEPVDAVPSCFAVKESIGLATPPLHDHRWGGAWGGLWYKYVAHLNVRNKPLS